jgi:hypothetical protein
VTETIIFILFFRSKEGAIDIGDGNAIEHCKQGGNHIKFEDFTAK